MSVCFPFSKSETIRGMSTSNTHKDRSPVKFCVQSSESHRRNYLVSIVLPIAILLTLLYCDPDIQNELFWILGGFAVVLFVIETAPVQRVVELCVEIGPLGIQRTTSINDRVKHHQLLPRACVKDCIITEHIQAFSISSNLMFRTQSALVPVFPDARLSFKQCESMLKQIQQALREQ